MDWQIRYLNDIHSCEDVELKIYAVCLPLIAENMLHLPIKTEDWRNTDMRVIYGNLSSGIAFLCRDPLIPVLLSSEKWTILEEIQ